MPFNYVTIHEIHRQAIDSGLHKKRDQLMMGIADAYVASIREEDNPSDQLRSDLQALNKAGPIEGVLPLKCWLDNAAHVTSFEPQRQMFFRAHADEIARGGGTTTTPSRAVTSSGFNPSRFTGTGPLMKAEEFHKQVCLIDRHPQFSRIPERPATGEKPASGFLPKTQCVLLLGPESEGFDLFKARIRGPFLAWAASNWGFKGPARYVPIDWTDSDYETAASRLDSYIRAVLHELGLAPEWKTTNVDDASAVLNKYLQADTAPFLVCWCHYESEILPPVEMDFLGRCVDWWGNISARPGAMPPLAIFALTGAEQCAELKGMEEADQHYVKQFGEKAKLVRRLPPLSRISRQHMTAWRDSLERPAQMRVNTWIESQFADAQKKMPLKHITKELEILFDLNDGQ